jgi:hypothetical protein
MVAAAEKVQAAKRRRDVTDLYLKGWTQEAIARALAVCQATVSRDLEEVRSEWRESALRDFDEARSQELQKIDLIEREAWAAWQRSQTPLSAAAITDDRKGQVSRRSLKHSHGDPRFLDLVNKCVAQRCLLLGLHSVVPTHGEQDEHIPLEVRHERLRETFDILTHLQGAFQPRTRPDGSQPGGVRDDGQCGEVADGAAPGVPRQDADGGP